MRNKKIGFFDSGVGGLTVIEAVHRVLPEYDTIYLGDTARAPYGHRSHAELVEFTWQACTWLFARGCELIIIACNTASASALREIQQTRLIHHPGRRVLGVIRPTVEELAKRGYKNILVLSTEATRKSGAYAAEFEKLNPEIRVHGHACPDWASMIEAGKVGTPELKREVEREVTTAIKVAPHPSAVLLACTHYPFVKKEIAAVLPTVPLFDQGELVAHSLKEYLKRHPEIESQLQRSSAREYCVTGPTVAAEKIAHGLFGFAVHFAHVTLT